MSGGASGPVCVVALFVLVLFALHKEGGCATVEWARGIASVSGGAPGPVCVVAALSLRSTMGGVRNRRVGEGQAWLRVMLVCTLSTMPIETEGSHVRA